MKTNKSIKCGRGLKDFVKKHKGKIAATAGVLGTIGAIGLASRYGNKNKKLKLDSSHPELGKFFENIPKPESEPLHLGRYDPELQEPYNPFLIDIGKQGRGKLDDFKQWIKKNKRVLGLTAGAITGALGTLAAITAASGQQPVKGKIRRLQEGEKPSSQVISEARFSAPAAMPSPIYQHPVIEEEAKRPYHEPAIVPAPAPSRSIRLKRLTNPLLPAGFKRNPFQGLQGSEGFKNILNPLGRGKCCCGRDCNEIMEKLGGYQVAQNYLIKYPKVGSGLIDNLVQKGVSKGFNLVGNYGLNLLIEVAVGLLGEEFRKDIVHLVKKYGWKSIKFIKKYANKGIDYIKKKVEENYGGSLCPQCNDFLDNEFRCGNIDSLEKMGSGWTDDLATGLTWFGKNVIAPAARIIPGSLGEALAYGPANLDKIGELGSPGWEYKDPFEDEKELPSYQGARSKAPKGKGFKKPEPKYKRDTFELLSGLIPSRLIGTMIGETIPINRGDTSIVPARFRPRAGEGKKKSKLVEYGKKFEKIVKYLPVDLLKELFWEMVEAPPSMSILPRRFRQDPMQRSIWGDGRSGGTKMLPKPEYTDEEKEMMILPIDEPEPEPEMRIQPYPYPVQHGRPQDAFLKPYGPYGRLPNMEMMEKMKKRTKNLINPLSDPKKFDEIVKNNGGKKKRKGRGKMTIKTVDANLPLMFLPEIPEHMSYSGSGDYKNLQDPNFNTNKLIVGKSDNKDYKSFESGMKHKAQGKIIIGGKKRTKKQIKKKLRFNL
jgi:hypothetical protein